MMIRLLLSLFLVITPAAFAGDVERGEAKAAVCVQCHGVAGNEPIANYPKIGGQYRKYLLYALRQYKSGNRPNAVMGGQMVELNEEDFADLAAYFAAQAGDLR